MFRKGELRVREMVGSKGFVSRGGNTRDEVLIRMLRSWGGVEGLKYEEGRLYDCIVNYFSFVKDCIGTYRSVRMPHVGTFYPRFLYCWRKRRALGIRGEELEYIKGRAIEEVMMSSKFKWKEDALRRYKLKR